MIRNSLYCVLSVLLLLYACRTEKKLEVGLITEKAMVVTAHPEATRIGVEILKKGGNAVDAAVAVQFALAVAYPRAGNIGGGGFMVARMNDGRKYALDFREMAPSAAHRDMYLDSLGEVIEDLSWMGHLACGVPGSVAGMVAAHDSLGKLSWKEVIQPSIDLARSGLHITEKEARAYQLKASKMVKYNTRPNAFTADTVWTLGDTVFQPDLARTLTAVRDQKEAGFYEGWVADSIVAEMERGGGIISLEDLKNYKAVWRTAVETDYKGYGLISMPPPSSGGIALAQLLESVENLDLRKKGFQSVEEVHAIVEAERRVYADRSIHLGDPDYYNVPQEGLMETAYLTERMADFDPNKASISDSIEAGEPMAESEQTTHFSIVDEDGNAVSLTTTINGSFGSCVVVGGAGFFLNNEMDDFSSKPGVPNYFGLLGSEGNSIQPGKRMLSSMTPTIVTRNDSLYMVVGTPGGSTIITSVFQNIINVLEHDFPMQASVSAKRFHHQWKPDVIFYEENTFSQKTMDQLKSMGHEMRQRGYIGRVDAILVRPDGSLEGGADPRGDDTADGY
ncbi:MAG: gamma-glutamyltransferase [Bacteroidota bacterium]